MHYKCKWETACYGLSDLFDYGTYYVEAEDEDQAILIAQTQVWLQLFRCKGKPRDYVRVAGVELMPQRTPTHA